MDNRQVQLIEAVLFAAGDPLPLDRIADAVGCGEKEAVNALEALKNLYDQREAGICLLRTEGRYQLATVPSCADAVQRALDLRRNAPLSQAAMETLAIIAYNQPVSRSFIEQVRGVDSSSSVQNLLGKGLIAEAGRLDLPGKPISFETTDAFLRTFALSSIRDLPPIEEEDLQYGGQTELLLPNEDESVTKPEESLESP